MNQDKITLERIANLHPALRDEVYEIYKDICEALTGKAMCRFAYTLRTIPEQDDLFKIGRRGVKGEKVVTNAKGGQSYHNYGLALDIVLIKDTNGDGKYETASWETNVDFDGDGKSDWQEVVQIFKRYGWEWGGDWNFSDKPHFQRTMGKSIVQLQNLYNTGKRDSSGYVFL